MHFNHETFNLYFRLFQYSLIPVVLSIVFFLLKRETGFGKWIIHYRENGSKLRNRLASNHETMDLPQQVIIGIAFGIVAIFGTRYGVKMDGATANVRDAAPLCAGLLFGGPAGIIAGLIGGFERWFDAAGDYSRVACTVSTVLAGFYAAFLREFIFENRRPKWIFSLFSGIAMEAFHLTVLFATHLNDADQALRIVKIVTVPMLLFNGLSVMMACSLVSLVSSGFIHKGEERQQRISGQVQELLFVMVAIAYLVTTAFVYILQTNTALRSAGILLDSSIDSVEVAIEKADMSSDLGSIASYRRVGNTGFLVIADVNGRILVDSEEHEAKTLEDAGLDVTGNKDEGKAITGELFGVKSMYLYRENSGYYIVAVIPEEEVFASRESSVYINSFMEIMVFAMLFIQIFMLIRNKVVMNIRKVNENLEKITDGDLNVKVDVHTSQEFKDLSDHINHTVEKLRESTENEKNRLNKELEFAKDIQHSSLPSVFPAFPNVKEFDIHAVMDTAKEVGGDFYDFFMPDQKHLAFLIADVSGKGIPAALFMMKSKTLLKSLIESGIPVNDAFTVANNKLLEGNDGRMFVTAWMGIMDITTGHIVYANAGHNPPFICRKDGTVEKLKCKAGFILAGIDDFAYVRQELDLAPGDRIVLYTDGVTEAENVSHNLFGDARLADDISCSCRMSVRELLLTIRADVDRFAGEAEQFDDITMLAVDYFGGEISMEEKIFPAAKDVFPAAEEYFESKLGEADVPMKAAMQMQVAFEEIFINIASYAYPDMQGTVKVGTRAKDGVFTIRFTDGGIPFNPLEREDPDVTLKAEDRSIGGLGIYMVKKSMDSVEYEYSNGCNILTITKKF